jgi:hypothetical protein
MEAISQFTGSCLNEQEQQTTDLNSQAGAQWFPPEESTLCLADFRLFHLSPRSRQLIAICEPPPLRGRTTTHHPRPKPNDSSTRPIPIDTVIRLTQQRAQRLKIHSKALEIQFEIPIPISSFLSSISLGPCFGNTNSSLSSK